MATQKLTREELVAKSKLRALTQGVQVWRLEAGEFPRYAVPSSSMDGTAYEVVVHNRASQDISCNCPGNVYRNTCKHVGAILLRLDLEAELDRVGDRPSCPCCGDRLDVKGECACFADGENCKANGLAYCTDQFGCNYTAKAEGPEAKLNRELAEIGL